ncbi:MAG: hypothetical protein E6G08_02390 [Actinobacteria bacterium]|nr:MAG: hypothetical protein E6G08_02390 [Actinomycetota bacterium]
MHGNDLRRGGGPPPHREDRRAALHRTRGARADRAVDSDDAHLAEPAIGARRLYHAYARPDPDPGVGTVQWLLSVSSDGATLVLGDGSQWQVAAASQSTLSTWTFNDDVTVQLVSGSTYTLTDPDAGGTSVTATYLGTSP